METGGSRGGRLFEGLVTGAVSGAAVRSSRSGVSNTARMRSAKGAAATAGAGAGAGATHPMANAKATKAITLLNRVAIAGYYTHAVTIQHVREGYRKQIGRHT